MMMKIVVHGYKHIDFEDDGVLSRRQKRECAKQLGKSTLEDKGFTVTRLEIRDG